MFEVITKAMNLLTYSVPFQLQYHYKFLLACTVSSREAYLEEKVGVGCCVYGGGVSVCVCVHVFVCPQLIVVCL